MEDDRMYTQTINAAIKKIEVLFTEANNADVKSQSIEILKENFEESMSNGGRNPDNLFHYICLLLREFRCIGLGKEFRKAIAAKEDFQELKRESKWSIFCDQEDRMDRFIR
jgi:hypothetical protein